MYPMPYTLFLASFSMGSPMFLLLFLDLTFPYYFQSLSTPPRSQSLSAGRDSPLFYLGNSPIKLCDSLSGYVHPGIACLAFQASDCLGALWASLSGYSSRHDPCYTNYDWSLLVTTWLENLIA